jgi:DNA-binding transcriptional LysR family regulator
MDIAGVGVTNVLSYQARAVARGKLRLVLQDCEPDPIPVYLVHPEQAIVPLKLRRFTEFAASRLRKSLAADLAKLSAPKTSAEKKK